MKKTALRAGLVALLFVAGCAAEKTPSLPVFIETVAVDRKPHSMIQDILKEKILVSCFGSESIVAVFLKNKTVDKKYTVRKGPAGMIRDARNQFIYCLHAHENAIVILGGNPLRVKRKLGTGAMSLSGGAMRPGWNELWICDGLSAVSVLQTPYIKLKKKIQLGRYPQHIAFSRDGRRAYITLKGENAVAVVDTKKREKIMDIPVGIYPKDIIISGNTACVSNFGSQDISMIDIEKNKEVARIKVRKNPNSLSIHKNTLWVSCERSYRLMAIDINQAKIIGTVKVGFYPGAVKALKDGSLVVAAPKKNRIAFVTLQDGIPAKD
ncbi:hypothetical protein K8S19_13035 [bacterium]|nr:hypothetical protein [bacterium]